MSSTALGTKVRLPELNTSRSRSCVRKQQSLCEARFFTSEPVDPQEKSEDVNWNDIQVCLDQMQGLWPQKYIADQARLLNSRENLSVNHRNADYSPDMVFKLLDRDGTILSTSLFRHIASASVMLPGREGVLKPDEEEQAAVEEQERENTSLEG